MAKEIWNLEWLAANSQRRYPLADTATAYDATGEFQFPDDVLVDMVWSVHSFEELDPAKFHLITVAVFSQNVIMSFGYDGTPVATVNVPVAGHTRHKVYKATTANDDFSDSIIRVAIGNLSNILAQPAGNWQFAVANGRIHPMVIRPDIRGVTALFIRNGEELSDPIQGDVELLAGRNFRLSVDLDAVSGRYQIRFDAIEGEGLNDDCECTGATLGPPIRTINGVGPRSDGNLVLLGDECVDIQADDAPNTLLVSDRCSNPCCGCNELEVVSVAIQDLANKVATTESYAQKIDSVTTQMQAVLLGSKIIYDPNRLQQNP